MNEVYLVRVGPILEAIRQRLASLEWTPPGGGPVAAFGQVVIYDLKDLAVAVRELLALDDRVALIIYEGDKWSNDAIGYTATFELVRQVTVLVTDRQLGDRTAATLGGDYNPGAYLLADLVNEDLLGSVTINRADAAGASSRRVWMRPTDGQPMLIEGRVREELVGRSAKVLSFEVLSGTASSNLDGTRL